MEEYLKVSEIIDWKNPQILELSSQISSKYQTQEAIAKACFEWVRDKIKHSSEYKLNPVTYKASDVLKYKTGFCFAKSHLLAALLRANNIPTGFCYQRLSIDDKGAPYSLHGLNAVYLNKWGWYRIDPRGNNQVVNAQFIPPQEKLAYPINLPEERDVVPEEKDFKEIFSEPLDIIINALKSFKTWDKLIQNLPDVENITRLL